MAEAIWIRIKNKHKDRENNNAVGVPVEVKRRNDWTPGMNMEQDGKV